MYEPTCLAAIRRPLEDMKQRISDRAVTLGLWPRHHWDSAPGYPVKIKTASASEQTRWPEFAAWPYGPDDPWRPEGLWVRCDLAHLAKERNNGNKPTT